MSKVARVTIFMLALLLATTSLAAPQWIEHASKPGPDRPSAGQSRFDDLFRQASGTYVIPYPFSDLVGYLNSRLENAPSASVRQVFIPRGRSLQRESAAPDYFKQPRVVIALEGEPRATGEDPGYVLEYRLFIAHQPSTESLEVISYNDEIGRFEFQVVNNYTADRAVQVHQANRAMCLSCHQNAGPIFAPNPWKETSFNIEIANRLIQAQPEKHASLVGLFTRDAGIIDVLVERANYLSAAQHIWRYGCQDQDCRGAMLRAILQYRLSSEASFNWHDNSYRQDYYTALQQNWERQWPQGLALAKSRIPDRDPLANGPLAFEQDPLFPRRAHASWYEVDSVLARGIIYRLAGFLTLADVRRLDRHLIRHYQQGATESRHYQAVCEIGEVREKWSTLVCGTAENPASLRARIDIEDLERFRSIRPLSVQIPGDTNIWQPDIVDQTQWEQRVQTIPGVVRSGLSARLSNGDRIVSMAFEQRPGKKYLLEIEVSEEARIIEAAIEKMLAVKAAGFSAEPFRRRVIVAELMQHLDMAALKWPARNYSQPATSQLASAELDDGLSLLNPYCGNCHSADTTTPPGFLYGADAEQRIRQCAPRILSRLESWQYFPRLQRSPMPPPASLGLSGVSVDTWPVSDHYHSLLEAISGLLIGEYAGNRYQELPPCLPSR